jgi:pyrroloquinoline quinone (PQQ) biosynthesis protein C
MTLACTPLFERLEVETGELADELLAIPFVRAATRGELSLRQYTDFLAQAFHHVRHTVPLLMAAGAAVGPDRPELQAAFSEYIQEERGHEEWILNDLRACGADAEAVRRSTPGTACEVLVAYAYDVVTRGNPVGFLGMVHVLEGTSVKAAQAAAEAIQARLDLPDAAFSYLTSHGALDIEHVDFFHEFVDRLTDPDDQRRVLHCCRVFYRLYGDVLRGLAPTH